MLRKIYKILAILLVGFVGGGIGTFFVYWVEWGVPVSGPETPIAIANTYIVFTTLIFVGITVVLAVAGYVFAQHFASSKHAQECELIEEIKKSIRKNENGAAVGLASAMLAHPDVIQVIEGKLEEKVDAITGERISDSEAEQQSRADSISAEDLSSQISGGEKDGEDDG